MAEPGHRDRDADLEAIEAEVVHDEGDLIDQRYRLKILAKSARDRADAVEGRERELRRILWLRHGHIGLYGDDGEMQCSICRIDYKRDSVELIEQRYTAMGHAALASSAQEPGEGRP